LRSSYRRFRAAAARCGTFAAHCSVFALRSRWSQRQLQACCRTPATGSVTAGCPASASSHTC